MRAQRGLQYLVCHSVCLSVCLSVRLSVTTFSAATRNKTDNKRYKRVQCHTGFILKRAVFCKNAAFERYGKTAAFERYSVIYSPRVALALFQGS